MNRKLLNGLLVLAVAAGGVGTFTSCKDEDFRNDIQLEQDLLKAQIEQIRTVTDDQFKTNLLNWLDNVTEYYSEYGFTSYEELVNATDQMYQIYQDIMNNNITGDTEKYVSNLYDWMFNNKISASDWYDLIYKVAQRATSVNLNQVKNPIFGTVNLPLGINTTVLGTYRYGGAEYSFPAGLNSENISNASPYDPTSDADYNPNFIQMLRALSANVSVPLVNNSFTDVYGLGNMGSAVVTINPSSNNFASDLYTVELVNSKDEVVMSSENEDLELLPLSDQDDALVFGASRADIAGLYKLNANATTANMGAFGFDLENKSELKEAIKNAIDNKSISNVAHIAEMLIKSVNNQLPAYAVKVSWEENDVDQATGVSKGTIVNSVYSDFDLAAVVLHPFSYNTNIGRFVPSGKSIKIFHNTLVEYIEKAQNKLTLNFDKAMPVDQITVYIEVKDGKVYFYKDETMTEEIGVGTYTADGLALTDDELTTLANALVSNYNDVVINGDVIKSINDAIDSINNALEQAENKVGDANDYLDRIKNSNKLDYAQKLLDIYNELATKANHFLANPNHYLQVEMAYSLGSGVHRMSNDINMPRKIYLSKGNKLSLIATSYTGDILVPSYKKYVAITGVVGQNLTTEQLISLNQQAGLNVVHSGTEPGFTMNLTDLVGKTLRITYASVDYRGITSLENFYMTVLP